MFRNFIRFYTFWVTLPNRFYPFSFEVEGKKRRGRVAYEAALARIQELRGPGSYGYTILMYREVFHFIGAVLFIALSAFVSQRFFGSETALCVLLGAAIFAITVQEFYLHPRYYNQHIPKSVIDWLTWAVPIGAYLIALSF